MMNTCSANRKLIFIIITLLVCIACLLFICTLGDFSSNVYATSQTNYEISTASDLQQFAQNVNVGLYDGYYGMTIQLTANIDLSGMQWTPIGNNLYPFKGSFDGCGYSIDGLQLVADSEMVLAGLFGFTTFSAEVKNLTVSGNIVGNNQTGAIVGCNQGIVSNCTNYATVSASNDSIDVGGIVGVNFGTIIQCKNFANVSGSFISVVGGICGSNNGKIEKCFNVADITITNSISGGIAGQNAEKAQVVECFNTGNVSGKEVVGGISGDNFGQISASYNTGDISAVVGNVGGISGYNEPNAIIQNTYSATNLISGASNVGAIVGFNRGIVFYVFYDSQLWQGSITNGYEASESAGLRTELMTHDDTLDNQSELFLLQTNNLWSKRNAETEFCFYPELTYFATNVEQFSKQSVSVSRQQLTEDDLQLTANEFVYSNEEHKPGVFLGDILLVEGLDYSVTYENNINAGKGTATFVFTNRYTGTIVLEFFINAKSIDVSWVVEEYVYNAQFQSPHLVVDTGVIGEQEITFEYLYENSIDAGTYTTIGKLADNNICNNYYLEQQEIVFTIKKRQVDIVWSTEKLVYNGIAQMPSIQYINNVLNNDELVLEYDFSQNIFAANYDLSINLPNVDANRNYELANNSLNYTIHKSTLIISWNDEYFVYDGEVHFPTAEIVSGNVGDDQITLSYSGYESNIGANESNEYFVEVCLADTETNNNYYLEPQKHYYNIYKCAITIAWWDTPLVYNGQPQIPKFYIDSGRVGDDEPEFVISNYDANTEAGVEYSITVELSTTDSIAKNYSMSPQVKNYYIEKAQFDIDDLMFEQYIFAYDGQMKELLTTTVLPKGVSISYENNQHTDIGAYSVIVKLDLDNNNYIIPEKNQVSIKMYIVQTEFSFDNANILISLLDNFVYGFSPNVEAVDKVIGDYGEFNKSLVKKYTIDSSGFDGNMQISLVLDNALIKNSGLSVAYMDNKGRVQLIDFDLDGCVMSFVVDGTITEFVLMLDKDYTAIILWICLGIVAIGVILTLFSVIKRCRHHYALQNVPDVGQSQNACTIVEKVDIQTDNNKAIVISNNLSVVVPNNSFTLDGVFCLSYEWFLRSLSVRNQKKQKKICAGDELAYKLKESLPKDSFFWKGRRYRTKSQKFVELLDKARKLASEKKI